TAYFKEVDQAAVMAQGGDFVDKALAGLIHNVLVPASLNKSDARGQTIGWGNAVHVGFLFYDNKNRACRKQDSSSPQQDGSCTGVKISRSLFIRTIPSAPESHRVCCP